jgi:ABC-2 type transport system permease protein
MTAFRLELRRDAALTLWIAVSLLVYGALMGALYPVIFENEELIRGYIEAFPPEFLAAFGMTGLLSDPGVFFQTYIASWLWPIVAGAAGIIVGTRAAADLDRGFLDLPLATPISRVRYLGASIAGQVLMMAILALAAVVGVLAVGRMVGGDFDPGRFLLAGSLAFAFGCAISAVATLLAVVTLSRGTTGGLVLGILIAMYLLNVAVLLAPELDALAVLTAFSYFETAAVIDEGLVPFTDLAVFGVASVAAWGAALALFRRRDLAA